MSEGWVKQSKREIKLIKQAIIWVCKWLNEWANEGYKASDYMRGLRIEWVSKWLIGWMMWVWYDHHARHFECPENNLVQVQVAPNRTMASHTFIWTKVLQQNIPWIFIHWRFSRKCIVALSSIVHISKSKGNMSFVKCLEAKIQYWSFETKYSFQWEKMSINMFWNKISNLFEEIQISVQILLF